MDKFLNAFTGKHLFFAALENTTARDKFKSSEDIPKPRTFPGTFSKNKPKLDNLNSEGWGIFFTVNEMAGARRLKSEVVKCRAIWIDDDIVRDEPRTDFPIPPSIIVNSSSGKYHYYWLTETQDFDQWNGVMATMVKEHGCDNNAKDLARVMRLPGFNHVKGDAFKVKCRIDSTELIPWEVIVKNFPPTEYIDKAGNKKAGEYKSHDDHVNAIIKGKNFHGSLQSVIANHANFTTSKITLLQIARGLVAQAIISGKLSESRLQRAQYMLSDDSIELQEMVNWAVESTDLENSIDIPLSKNKGIINYELDYPPGLMGKLCEQIYEMAPHPNKEVAIMGAFALVAGVVGRKFNVLDMGLNLYIALLADSGIGKANIKDVINKVLVSGNGNMQGSTYKGHSRFTGPRPIFEMLITGLSRVCILEESGLMNLSTAGDQIGINRALLDIYTSSGKYQYAGGEAYSDSKSSIPLIHSPALTIAHVSTPKSFMKALRAKDSTTSGEMARLWTLRSMNDKKYLNRDKRSEFSDDVDKRLTELMILCSDRQKDTDGKSGKVIDVIIPKKIFDDADHYTDLENQAKKMGDDLKRTILSRAFAKSLKIASVISVFNSHEEVLDETAYAWAKKEALGKEIRYIEDSYTHESSDDMTVLARTIGVGILKCLHREYKKETCNADPRIAKYGIFSKTNIHQIFINNHQLKEIDDPTDRPKPMKGIDKVLEYMVKRELLHTVSENKMKGYGLRVKSGYQITDDFKVLMESD